MAVFTGKPINSRYRKAQESTVSYYSLSAAVFKAFLCICGHAASLLFRGLLLVVAHSQTNGHTLAICYMNHSKSVYMANHTTLNLQLDTPLTLGCTLPLTSVSDSIFAIYTFSLVIHLHTAIVVMQ